MKKLGSLAIPWAHSKAWSDWADAQADLSNCWAHRSFCWFCYAAAHLIWAGPWENVSYVICEQQRLRSGCASAQSDQGLCCSLLRQSNISQFYSWNFNTLTSFCGFADRFVSGVVGIYQRHVLSCRGSCKLNMARKTILMYTYSGED